MSQTTQENLLFRITVEQTGSSIGEIDQLTKSINGLNTAAKGTGGAGTGGLQKMLDGINMSAKELNTVITSLTGNLNKLNSGTASSGMSKLSSSTEQASAALQAGTRAAEGFAAGMNGAMRASTGVGDQLNLLKGAATSASSAANVLTAGFEKFATAGAMAEKNMFGVANTLSTFGRQADSAAASAQKLGQAENSATSATQRMTQASEASNVASQSGLGYDKERAQQWIQNIRHISGTALSFMSLYQAMDSVQGIGEMVAMQQEKVNEAQDAYNKAVAQFGPNSKQAIQAHDQLAKASRGLAYEQREANFAMHNMLFMVGLIGIELTNSLLPMLVKASAALKGLNSSTTMAATGVSGVAETLAGSAPGFNIFSGGAKKAEKSAVTMAEEMVGSAPKIGYVGKGLEGVSRTAVAAAPDIAKIGEEAVTMGAGVLMGAEAAGKMSLGQKVMSAASKIGSVALGGLGVSAGAAAALTLGAAAAAAIAAAGLVLYGTNAFGARDAMNAMGVEIGKVNPVLKTVGDLAVIVAGKLGLTGENAAKAQGHITDLGKDFNTLSTIWNDVVANMQKSDNIIIKDIGNAASLIGTDLKTMAGHFTTQVGASISTWQKLTDAIEKHDYKTAVNIIEQAFSAIPGIIQQIFVDVDKVFTDFMRGQLAFWKNLGATIIAAIQNDFNNKLVPAFKAAFDALVGIGTEVINRLVKALGLEPVINNIKTGVQTIINTFNGIVTGIQDMGKAIMDKILGTGDLAGQAQAWLNTNIYTPLGKVVDGVVAQGKEIITKLLGGDVLSVVNTWLTNAFKPFSDIGKTIGDKLGLNKQGDQGTPPTDSSLPSRFPATPPSTPQGPEQWNAPGAINPSWLSREDFQNAFIKPQTTGQNPLATAGVNPTAYNPFGQQQAGYQFAGLNGTIAQGPIGSRPQGQASPTGSSEGDRASVGAGGTPSGDLGDAPKVQQSTHPAAAGKKPEVTLTPKMEESSGGIRDENKAYQELDDTVKKLQTSYKDYNEILTTNKGINELQSKGIVEQQTAYQGMQAALVTSKAANQEYAQQVKEGGIVNTAYGQGIEDQKKALMDSVVELGHSAGAHQELNDEMKTGAPQMVAFGQGMDEQVGALQQQQLATAKSAGTIKVLSTQMADGSAQTAAYADGFVNTTLAIDQQEVAVDKTNGTIDAYTAAISSGQLANISYNEGVNKQRQALIDNYTAMNQAGGALGVYVAQLKTGVPQALAFENALIAQQTAAAKLEEDIGGLQGTVQGLMDNLSNSNTVLSLQTKAYYEGGQAAAEWGNQIVAADAGQRGLVQGLQEVGKKLGVSTDGFVGNADELKNWIEIVSGAGDAIEQAGQKIYESGVQAMSDFDKALADGGKGAEDSLKKIEDQLGIDFPQGIKDALAQAGTQDILGDNLKKMIEMGQRAVEHADPSAMANYIDQIKEKGMEALGNLDTAQRTKAAAAVKGLSETLATGPDDSSAEAYNRWGVKVEGYLDQIKRAGDPAVASMKPLTTMTFSEQPAQAVAQLIQAMSNHEPLSAYQQSLLDIVNSTPDAAGKTNDLSVAIQDANGNFIPAATTIGGATTATNQFGAAALDAAKTGLAQLAQALPVFSNELIPAFVQAVTTGLQPLGTAFTTIYKTIMTGAQTFFASFTQLFNTSIASLATPLAQMVQAFQITFSTILQNITTFMQQFLQKVQQGIQQITTAVNTLVGVFNNAFKRAVDDAEGYLKSLVQVNNQTFQQITSAVTKVVGAFNDSFKRATSDAGGYLKQLGTLAGQVMQQIAQKAATAAQGIAKIGQSAQQAASQVRSLANEINSLKDKTVYINIVRRYSGPAYAAGTPGAVFMGKGGQMTSVVYGDRAGTRNSRVIVGESGDETVMRTGLKSNRTRIDNVKHIKYITGLGANEPEMLTVVPQEGTNAQQFRNKYPEFYADGTPGIYNAGSYPNPFAAANNPASPGRQMPSGFSQMLYGRITKDRHGNITIGGRVVFRAGGPLDIDAYEGRHISHGSHGDPDDKHHFQQFDGSNEDIKHNGIPFSFGSATGFQVQKGMETGIGGTRGQVVGGPMGTGIMTKAMMDEMNPADTVPAASMDRMVQSRRVYSDYISERVAAARDRPRTQQQDSVYGNVDNQGNPLSMEYNENAYPTGIEADTPLMHPHTRGPAQIKPTRSYEEDYNVFIARLINEITKKVDGKIKINLHSQVDTRIWGKITNSQVLNDMVRS